MKHLLCKLLWHRHVTFQVCDDNDYDKIIGLVIMCRNCNKEIHWKIHNDRLDMEK